MIALTFVLCGLTLFTLLIVAEEWRRFTARLRVGMEEAFGHAHRVFPTAPAHVPAPGKFGRGVTTHGV